MIISFRSAPVFGGILSVLSRRCRPSVLFTRLTDALEPTDGSDEVDRYALLPVQRDDLTDQMHYIVALFIGFGWSHRRAVGLVATLAADTASRPWDDTRITDATGQPHDSLATRLRGSVLQGLAGDSLPGWSPRLREQPGIVLPAFQGDGGDGCHVGMDRVDQDTELVRHNHRRHQQQGSGAGGGPAVAGLARRQPGRDGVPAAR